MSTDKVRIYELARRLNVESKMLIDVLKAQGHDVKTHMTAVDADAIRIAEDFVRNGCKMPVVEERRRSEPAAAPASIPVRPGKVSAIPPARGKDGPSTPAEAEEAPEPPAAKASPATEKKSGKIASKAEEPSVPKVAVTESTESDVPTPPVEEPNPEVPPAAAVAKQPTPGAVEPESAEPIHSPESPRIPAPAPRTPGSIPSPNQRPLRDLSARRPAGNGSGQSNRPAARSGRDEAPRVVIPPQAPQGRSRASESKPRGEAPAQRPLQRFTAGQFSEGKVQPPLTRADEKPAARGTEDNRRGVRPATPGTGGPAGRDERQRRRKTRSETRDEEEETGGLERARAFRQRQQKRHAMAAQQQRGPVVLESPVTVRSFSEAAGVRAGELMKRLMQLGSVVTINSGLSEEQAELLALELGIEVSFKRTESAEDELDKAILAEQDPPESLVLRAPIVTFMGHVDHGKTSLMDRIRQANVVATESGGITQHVAAYKVPTTHAPGFVTFLDTPGHEAFTAMRARGADITDIVVLVVAADDGVMPQTEEALSHAKAAGVDIVVAMNKIDLPGANTDRLMQQLAGKELVPEAWGGDTMFLGTSAVTGQGVEELLEALALLAELRELKANPEKPAVGNCVEACLNQDRGVEATLLVRAGTLRKGDAILCGTAYGRVRAMFDDQGQAVEEAGPSVPVMVSGLDVVPDAGDTFLVVKDLPQAREIAEQRRSRQRRISQTDRVHITLDQLSDTLETRKLQELKLIIKADVRGSLEALRKEIAGFSHDEIRVRVLHEGVGAVSESDILLADASDAIVIAFRVIADDRAASLASDKGVEVRRYEIIYQVADDIKMALEGMLKPETREMQLGRAVIQETFSISRVGTIAGCRVVQGNIERNAKMRVIRDGTVIGSYPIESLRRVKDDVREVREGLECGIKLAGFDDVKRGDLLEAFRIEEIKRTL